MIVTHFAVLFVYTSMHERTICQLFQLYLDPPSKIYSVEFSQNGAVQSRQKFNYRITCFHQKPAGN